jgi:TonB-dependent Receptor Plug Domain
LQLRQENKIVRPRQEGIQINIKNSAMKKIYFFLFGAFLAISGFGQRLSDSIHYGTQNPIYILDSVLSNKDALSKLDPNDIESISVWKGKSAVERYGNMAAGGAIVISTKTAARRRLWSLLCASSNKYEELIKSPEADSIVTYKLNGEIILKSSEARLYEINALTLKEVSITAEPETSAGSVRQPHYIVSIIANLPK